MLHRLTDSLKSPLIIWIRTLFVWSGHYGCHDLLFKIVRYLNIVHKSSQVGLLVTTCLPNVNFSGSVTINGAVV